MQMIMKASSKVEFYINDELIETDTEYPYEYVWNTTEYDNGTEAYPSRS